MRSPVVMAEENRVCVVDCCTSSDSTTSARLLSELTGSSVEGSAEHVKWAISNRYYEAQVSLEVKGDLEDEEKGAWQSIITLCNLDQPSSVKKAYSVWEGLPSEATPPVSLLVGVVEGCGLREGVRSEVVKWCLERGVEFVVWELDPPQNEDEEEDDFPESVGVARVSEALQAHMWPDMRLKKRGRRGEEEEDCDTDGGVRNGGQRGGGGGVSCSERTSGSTVATPTPAVNGDSETKETGPGKTDAKHNEQSCLSAGASLPAADESGTCSEARLNTLLGASDVEVLGDGGGEKEGEDFETLFAKFADMKAHAQSLPHEERKGYAEKVVMSFWKAIGGDEGEVCSDSDS